MLGAPVSSLSPCCYFSWYVSFAWEFAVLWGGRLQNLLSVRDSWWQEEAPTLLHSCLLIFLHFSQFVFVQWANVYLHLCIYTCIYIYTYMYFSKGGMAEGSGNSFTQVFFSLHTQSVLPALPPHLFTFLTVSPKISLFKENMQVSKIWLTANNVLLFFDLLFSRNITRSFLSHTYQTTFLSHCYFQVHFPPPCSHSYFFPSSPSARPVRELAPNWSWFPGHGEGQWEKVNGKCHVSQASRRHTPNSALIGFFLADSHYQD